MKRPSAWLLSVALLLPASGCGAADVAHGGASRAVPDANSAQANAAQPGGAGARQANNAGTGASAGAQPAGAPSSANSANGLQVQVLPYDAVLHPGQKQKFTVKVYDAKGNPVQAPGEIKWSIGQLTFIPPPRPRPEPLPDDLAAQQNQNRAQQPGQGGGGAPRGATNAPENGGSGRRDPSAAPGNTTPGGETPAAANAPGGKSGTAPGGQAGGASENEREALARAAEQQTPQPQKIGNLKGEVSPDGTFTAAGNEFQGGAVMAAVGGATGEARVRVIPPLPWTFDFEKNPVDKPPLNWLGAGGKFAVMDKDGGHVLTKLTTLDLYARARTNFGTTDLSNYTIQADVRVGSVNSGGRVNMPDAGVINQTYVLVLLGNHQQLEIHEWPAALPYSFNRNIPFKWEPNTWYTLKLRVTPGEKSSLIEGKAWKRGEPEPQQWSIRIEDPVPQKNGAPGLYGNSLVTPIKSEIDYDNILVTDNKSATSAATTGR